MAVDREDLKRLIASAVAELIADSGLRRHREQRFVSQKELAQILGLAVPTVIGLRKKGRLPAARIGNKWRYEVGEVWEALRDWQ